MITFLKQLFTKGKDPEALDQALVRRYFRINKQIAKLSRSNRWSAHAESRALWKQMMGIRYNCNEATFGEIERLTRVRLDALRT
jgi:hypothetical protein